MAQGPPNEVLALVEVGRAVARAGGKGANLGELIRAGFDVPPGFVITTAAYRQAAGAPEWPVVLRRQILDAYARLGGGPVAVRSSATAEDLPDHAFAGQQDTELGVVGDEALLAAVRRCWASLHNARAVAYRAQVGWHEELAMAVVVQAMVEADVAGVMFTADPVTGDRRRVVVDASPGLGEAVVSGAVTPDHLVLNRRGRLLTWTVGEASGDAGGERRRGPVLAAPVRRRLVALGLRAAAHFGAPQDLEWAVRDGRVWLLQARPMTALPPPRMRLNPLQRRAASVTLDYVTERPYPLDVTTWWRHGPVGMMAKVADAYGLRAFDGEMLPEVDGVVDHLVPTTPRPGPRALLLPYALGRRARRFDPARWTEDPRYPRYLKLVAELNELPLGPVEWTELGALPGRVFAAVDLVTQLRIDYLPGTGWALLKLLVVLGLLGHRELLGGLLSGARTQTTAGNDALVRLAAGVRADAQAVAAFDASGTDLVSWIADDSRLGWFRPQWEEFLAAYGHRETGSPILASSPTWSERPEVPLGLLAGLVHRPEPAPDLAPTAAVRAAAALEASPRLRSPAARDRVRRVVAQAQAGLAFREDSHAAFLRGLPPLRRALLEMGRRLGEVGVLDTAGDVFHLRLEELVPSADPRALPVAEVERLRALVGARRRARDARTGVPLIDLSQYFPAPRGDALVRGAGASRGVASGAVRVIGGPGEFDALQPGEVLVCPYTNPSWTPLFTRAVAVVVDAGGVGSHAAIVAREYGVPAVMGTGVATRVLHTGQRVTVDGTRGRVTAADPG